MERRRFTAEFKAEAVRQALQPGISKTKVAQELEIHGNVLRKWVRQARGSGTALRSAQAEESAASLAQENQRLQKELARVKMERDILKKATAYFAKESL
jgi:transposase